MTPTKYILISFAAIILVGAFLLCLPISNTDGKWLPFIDGLFTATSSVCVTGLAVFDVALEFTLFGEIVTLILVQIGGLGFVTIASMLFLLIGKKINYSTRMALQESLSKEHNQGVVKTVIRVVAFTLVSEFVGFLLLAPSMIHFAGDFWKGLYFALFLAITAFCHAGFDPFGVLTTESSSLVSFSSNPFVLIPIMLLVVVSSIGFVAIFDLFKKHRNQKRTMLHTRVILWMTGILIFAGAGLFLILEWNNPNTIGNMNFGEKILNAFFQSITTRSSGFATVGQAELTPISQALSGVLMFIGGSPMSLAGGIKTTTLFVLLLMLFKNTDREGNIIYKNKKIKNSLISKAVRITLIATMFIMASTALIYLFEDGAFSLGSIIFESISAVCTVGLSVGVTPLLGVGSKLVLSILMYAGRIGMLAIPLAFKTKDYGAEIEYVEARITVG